VHPHAESAAETAEFAGAHGKFWEMHDLLFENQNRLSTSVFFELAQKLNLSPGELNQALEGGKFAARVRAEFSGGVRSGVNRTPTFFLNGDRYDGPVEFTDLVTAIDKAIAGENSSSPGQ